MTKSQKIIVLIAAALIVAAILYPPYKAYVKFPSLDQHDWSESFTGWDWIFRMTTLYETIGAGYRRTQMNEIRFGLLSVEIFGILVLAGATFLIFKKIEASVKDIS